MKGSPTKGIIFWRAGPLQYRLPPLGECSGIPSISVYQLVLLWEATFSFSEFVLKTQHVYTFRDGWFTNAPVRTVLGVQKVLTRKQHDPRVPPSLFTQSCPEWLFPRKMEEVLKGKRFANVEKLKQKTAETLKVIRINEFKNCFEQ